jgi:alkanesulfonate monooxygenase SsuD/methylene tetrahydromethanopterin reductase-like flavin-dependent oxidoreductase (luciferase family)
VPTARPSLPYAPPDRVPQMINQILMAAAEAGRDHREIERIYNLEISFDSESEADVGGSAEQIAERLIDFENLGFTGFNFQPIGPDREAQIERLASDVIPVVQDAVK